MSSSRQASPRSDCVLPMDTRDLRSGLRFISAGDGEHLGLGWDAVVDLLWGAFWQKARGLVENPPKPAVHPRPDSFAHAMPAYLGGSDALGCKWISGYSRQSGSGLATVQGLMIVSDAATGYPVCVIEGSWLTAVRTAGVSALVAARFGRASQRLAIVGCGVEGRHHLEALLHVCPQIKEVRAYSPRPAKAEELLAKAGPRVRHVAGTAEAAIAESDLVVTATPMDGRAPVALAADALAGDSIVLPIDFDRSWRGNAIHNASLLCVDDRKQFEYYRSAQYFSDYPTETTELAEMIVAPERASATGRRFFLNLGLAMTDVAIGAEVWRRAYASEVGTVIPWRDEYA